MGKPYYKCWKGKEYNNSKLLILSESAYSWLDEGRVVEPSPTHPKKSLLHWIEHLPKQRYFTGMSRALCGTKTPTLKETKQAWNECAYTIFVQKTVGIGAGKRPTREQFREAGSHFLRLIENIRPSKVIVTGKDMWNHMPETSVWRGDNLKAYRLSTGNLVWCLALPHPSNRREGFKWEKISESISQFRSAKLPYETKTQILTRGYAPAFASRIASTSSRTAPLPPLFFAMKDTFASTAGRASAGAADRPAIFNAGRSLTSSPIKQMSCNGSWWRSANAHRAVALS